MPANQFAMRHREVEVTYRPGVTPGLPVLTDKDESGQRNFTETEVRTEDTALGSLVSGALATGGIGAEGERFGFYLPEIDIDRGQTARFRTAGVYEDFSGVGTVPPQPASWRSIELHGTAKSVIEPEV